MASGSCTGYSGFDPMEDTESQASLLIYRPLRWVTAGSIRWRILKVSGLMLPAGSVRSYSGFDPMEDTES